MRKTTEHKPDYNFIQAHSCKEFVVIVRRLIMHERLFSPRMKIHHFDAETTFDVVLHGRSKLWLIRHKKGTTTASYQQFPVQAFEMLTDEDRPDLKEFLKGYHVNMQPLDPAIWPEIDKD